jgi:hypothetical protein
MRETGFERAYIHSSPTIFIGRAIDPWRINCTEKVLPRIAGYSPLMQKDWGSSSESPAGFCAAPSGQPES